jgi:LuxR family maltose regulon positive regulatory protein
MCQDLPSAFPPLLSQEPHLRQSSLHSLQLLATKISMPPPRPHLVARTHLLERWHAGLMGKLTLISAPAGFGKTTLVSAWLATRTEGQGLSAESTMASLSPPSSVLRTRVAWVSLDASDNDPTRFWTYVITDLETVYPHVGMSTMALLRSPEPPRMEAILTPLLNAVGAMSTAAALILDDYHLITTPAIHSAVAFLLDHLPAQLHLIMLTRADPPLPLTRLRMRGELTELRAADLRFTAAEAAAFLTDVMALPLTSEQVAALEIRTEGWVAGLQLAALAMQNRSDHAGFVSTFSGTNRFVVDYLVEEVMSRLPAHLQMFLTQTAILDRMCGSLCDAVLEIGGWGLEMGRNAQAPSPQSLVPNSQAYSQLILDQLEQANLFVVPLDDERHWYRYHHLFADVLRIRLHSGAAVSAVATLHQRASRWYEQAGLIGEAVRYALLAHESEHAADLIDRHAMAQILARSDVLLVQSWIQQRPRTVILARPQLTLITGFSMVYHGQFTAVERLLVDAAPALSAPDLDPNIRGELALLRSMIARLQNNATVTLDHARQALAQLALDNHGMRGTAAINIGVFYKQPNTISRRCAVSF